LLSSSGGIEVAKRMAITILIILAATGLLFSMALASERKPIPGCKPTPSDALGPFYKSNAPLRANVGKGYVLTGSVKSAQDCLPVEGARIEFWLAGPNGQYDDDHRASLISDNSGRYTFQSNFPPPYSSRRPHIHIRVTADGYKPLVTQHYPVKGQPQGTFDLVMIPEPS
jgi:protocatechuate 3,4-dioxygenase beta subunit